MAITLGSPYVHSFIWIFNLPNIRNEANYKEFIKNRVNAQLRDQLNNPELFGLVKTYQVHAHSRNCWKYSKSIDTLPKNNYFKNTRL